MNKIRLRAITLIESLLYLALFGVVFITMIQFVFSVSENNQTSDLSNEIKKAGIFLNEHVDDSFVRSVSINSAGSTFDNNNGVLSLNLASGTLRYNISSDRVNFTDASIDYFLTNADLKIDAMRIERINDMKGVLKGVRVTFTISSVKKTNVSDTFINTYVYN